MARRIGHDRASNVVERGESGDGSLAHDRIAYPGPGQAAIVGALHPNQGGIRSVMVGDVNDGSIARDPGPVIGGEVDDLRSARNSRRTGLAAINGGNGELSRAGRPVDEEDQRRQA